MALSSRYVGSARQPKLGALSGAEGRVPSSKTLKSGSGRSFWERAPGPLPLRASCCRYFFGATTKIFALAGLPELPLTEKVTL